MYDLSFQANQHFPTTWEASTNRSRRAYFKSDGLSSTNQRAHQQDTAIIDKICPQLRTTVRRPQHKTYIIFLGNQLIDQPTSTFHGKQQTELTSLSCTPTHSTPSPLHGRRRLQDTQHRHQLDLLKGHNARTNSLPSYHDNRAENYERGHGTQPVPRKRKRNPI